MFRDFHTFDLKVGARSLVLSEMNIFRCGGGIRSEVNVQHLCCLSVSLENTVKKKSPPSASKSTFPEG